MTETELALSGITDPAERQKAREKYERVHRKNAEKIANGLVARMDNVRFLRGFAVSLCSLRWPFLVLS